MELPQTSLDKLASTFKSLGVQAPSLLTKIGILRALFIEIECAKKDGYLYGVILETLIRSGLKATTPNQFYGLMNRIRLERGFTQVAVTVPASPGLLDRSRRPGDKEASPAPDLLGGGDQPAPVPQAPGTKTNLFDEFKDRTKEITTIDLKSPDFDD